MASIQTRTKRDGTTSYRVMFRLGEQQKSETFPDADSAAEFVRSIKRHGPAEAVGIRAAVTKHERARVLSEWMDEHVTRLTGVTDGTRKDYKSITERHINPTLGNYPLPAIDRKRIDTWVNLLTPKMSSKTLRNTHSLLSGALSRAVLEGLIPGNPAKGIRLPKSDQTKEEPVALSANEFTILLGHFDEHWQPLVATMAGTGLRWGEVTALPVGACYLDQRPAVLRVKQAWKHTGKSQRVLGPPKTEKGRRTVSISPELAALLRPLLKDKKADDLVFTTPGGAVVDHAHFYERVWKPTLTWATAKEHPNGDPKLHITRRLRIHDLRHSHGSWLLDDGVPLARVSRRLGHQNIQTTVNVYGHMLPDDLRGDADAITRVMAGSLPAIEGTDKADGQD